MTYVIALNVIRRRWVQKSDGDHVRAFSTWRTWTGSSNVSPAVAHTSTV